MPSHRKRTARRAGLLHRLRPGHAASNTNRPETPSLEGIEPLPEEITGLASATAEDLVTLFDGSYSNHLADGFKGGSEDITDAPTFPGKAQ